MQPKFNRKVNILQKQEKKVDGVIEFKRLSIDSSSNFTLQKTTLVVIFKTGYFKQKCIFNKD